MVSAMLSVLLAAAPAPCFSQAPQTTSPAVTAPTATNSSYALMVDRLRAGDSTVDFTALRTAFTRTPAYRGMMMAFYQPLWRTLNAGDFEGAVKVADRVLDQNYAEPNAHMVAALAHRALGHIEQADFHLAVADGLIKSITSKGDGNTVESAYQVIDISEEYALFRAMKVSMKSQAMVGSPVEGRPIVDRVVVVDSRTNEERTMFFSVDNPTTVRR